MDKLAGNSKIQQKPKGKPRGRAFEKGKSGNPSGRPSAIITDPVTGETINLRELARSYTVKAIDVLAGALDSPDERVRLDACKTLLDRGWGRAAQSITGEDGEGPVKHAHSVVVEFIGNKGAVS